MSGFETRWLDLREPADRAARDGNLRRQAIASIAGVDDAVIVDLGSGTGATLRALSPECGHRVWRLVDNDPLLLDEARRRHGAQAQIDLVETDLKALPPEIFEEACMVTASALFDLTSQAFVQALAARIADRGIGFYAALNYDGQCRWDQSHADDAVVVEAFNRHQRGDKGFGPALGPDSGPVLQRELQAVGLQVAMAASPWRLGPGETELQRQFIEGMASAVAEGGGIASFRLEEWRRYRLSHLAQTRCEIGHWDVLALART